MNAATGAQSRNKVLVGDAVRRLGQLASGSVDLVLTSPPYFRLRDYQIDGQLGLEPTVEAWVDGLRPVLAEVARVLVPTGTLWLNLGDSYATHHREGASRKSLLLGPERLALALLAEGWTIRNKIVWAKTSHLPSPVTDRLTASHEVIYLLTRSPSYFFDLHAVRQPHLSRQRPQPAAPPQGGRWQGPGGVGRSGLHKLKAAGISGHPLGKNPGDVWALAPSSGVTVGGTLGLGGHHATFPLTLASRAIQAGCPEARCTACRTPWRRTVHRLGQAAVRGDLHAGCGCRASSEPGLVLDPFLGAGTTAVAAERLGRDWLGIELNPAFAALAERRIAADHRRRHQATTSNGQPQAA